MSEQITVALALLDGEDDSHWTDDGLPKVEAVQAIVGEEITVDRQAITDAAPKFTRLDPTIELNLPDPVPLPDDADGDGEIPVVQIPDLDTRLEARNALIAERDKAQAELNEAVEARSEFDQVVAAAEEKVRLANESLYDENVQISAAEQIQIVNRSNQKNRAARAEAAKAMANFAVGPGLNAAMAAKGSRPKFNV